MANNMFMSSSRHHATHESSAFSFPSSTRAAETRVGDPSVGFCSGFMPCVSERALILCFSVWEITSVKRRVLTTDRIDGQCNFIFQRTSWSGESVAALACGLRDMVARCKLWSVFVSPTEWVFFFPPMSKLKYSVGEDFPGSASSDGISSIDEEVCRGMAWCVVPPERRSSISDKLWLYDKGKPPQTQHLLGGVCGFGSEHPFGLVWGFFCQWLWAEKCCVGCVETLTDCFLTLTMTVCLRMLQIQSSDQTADLPRYMQLIHVLGCSACNLHAVAD